MSQSDWIRAAQLAMPGDARLTDATRIQALGLEVGPLRPFHFVVASDLHIAIDDVILHRTEVLPPCDDVGVRPVSAYLALCAHARVIDAIAIGDWLLREGHMTRAELIELAVRDRWRAGAKEARWIVQHLSDLARSLPESKTRAVLTFAGLPHPEVNAPLSEGATLLAVVDLAYRRWRTVVEYEGGQHQQDRGQWLIDIDRYALMRRLGISYVQVTKERLRTPRVVVSEVFRVLVANGYDGPAPSFGRRWESLFGSITAALPDSKR